jgi:hypothetical protein
MENRSSIRQVQEYTRPSAELDFKATPDIKDHSSPVEYSKQFLAVYGCISIGGIRSVLPSLLHPGSNLQPATAKYRK